MNNPGWWTHFFWDHFRFIEGFVVRTLDILLVVSTVFTLVYALALLISGLRVARLGGRPCSWAIPGLFVVSAVLACAAPGRAAAALWEGTLLWGFGPESWSSHVFVQCLGWSWAFWVLVAGFRMTRRYAEVRLLAAASPEHGDDPAFHRALSASGLGRKVRLLRVGADCSVASWGVLRPCVLVPDGFVDDYGPDERYMIYLHELQHIRRYDAPWYFTLSFVKILFWFHPVVCAAIRRCRNDAEMACDRAVTMRFGVTPRDYAETMLKTLARNNGVQPAFSGGFTELRDRLESVLSPTGIYGSRKRMLGTGAVLVLVLAGAGALFRETIDARLDPPSLRPSDVREYPGGYRIRRTPVSRWRGALGDYITVEMVVLPPEAPTDSAQSDSDENGFAHP